MTKTVRITMIAGVVFAMMLGATAMAQEQRGQRGQRGQFDPAQMQAMMMERIQEQLGATDEEWKVIQPLVANVMEKQRNAMQGGFRGVGMRFGPGGPGAPGGPAPQAADRPQREGQDRGQRGGFRGVEDPDVTALQTVLENKDASPEEIKAKLNALRTTRAKREAELKTAREELRKVLTLRQEAQLVLMGMLD
ncbi:MAG TPA: hypothetical protein PK878_03915 [bacterium]|nr:hypothetical protein [Candidatus Omnitrophota bacterium]HOJ59409.1 hypothetical protein [bacterium]HOL95340.1 hypothetical protein [bacterium]HPP02644.1 hypothetical protein [bacterium]HXK96006.1 hypothetical protein [bacterium]